MRLSEGPHWLDRPNASVPWRWWLLALLPLVLLFTWIYTRHFDLLAAYVGFTPLAWVYQTLHPQEFAHNFVGGTEQYDKSAFLHVYLLAQTVFHVSPEALYPWVVGLEVFLMAGACVALMRTLFPQGPWVLSLLMVLWIVGSFAQNMSLSRFAHPFFVGQFYNVADALRIFAMVLALRGRLALAGLLLAGSFITHPIYALIGGLFSLAALAVQRFRYPLPQWLGFFLLPTVVGGLWFLRMFDPLGASTDAIPDSVWFDLTRLNSVHWYPFEQELFGQNHTERFIQYLSFLLILGYYLKRRWPLSLLDRQVLAGMGVLAVLVILGLVFSVTRPSPTLIKLSLQRADDLFLLFGLAYVLQGLWEEVRTGRLWRQILVVAVMFSPMFMSPGFPLILGLLVASPALCGVWKKETPVWGNAWVTGGMVALVALTVLYQHWYATPWMTDKAYVGTQVFWTIVAVFALGWMASEGLKKRWPALSPLWILGFLVCSSLWAAREVNHGLLAPYRYPEAQAYKGAQLWASEKTPQGSLFMVDPTLYYGWRDYAHRPSFGNLREWLYAGWLYDSNYAVYKKGLQHFNEFGVPLQPYLKMHPNTVGFWKLSDAVHDAYYGLSAPKLLDMARRYGLAYAVFKRADRQTPLALPIAYQNEGFIIYRLPVTKPPF